MMRQDGTRSEGLMRAVEACGGSVSELARRLGISNKSINDWYEIPKRRVPAVSQATGIPEEDLR
jgi:DNA-binding transcriptional regulator YdaS (Cro superfamily)